ncbi:class I SAM-dependent methyltransferase [Paraburkholderia sp. JPY419]|uniref:class I SAM-dependent methyltransferase n=1 Tax=Paraburkholderia sp. JPY419 TaxID=667660 RepID=UPI003D1C7677
MPPCSRFSSMLPSCSLARYGRPTLEPKESNVTCKPEPIEAGMVDELVRDALLSQLRCPTGAVGKVVGNMMERVNAGLIDAAYRKLDPQAGDRMLEIGLGNGGHVASALALAPFLTLTGIDTSPTMIAAARSRNAKLIESGQLHLETASVTDMPFENDAFDRAISINSVYFWPNLTAALRRIRRVMSDDGVLVIAAMTPEASLAMPFAEHGFRVYDPLTYRRTCSDAGFEFVHIGRYTEKRAVHAAAQTGREFLLVRATCK